MAKTRDLLTKAGIDPEKATLAEIARIVKPTDIKKGQWWRRELDRSEGRVMAVAEGYVLIRFRRCMPFVVSEKDLKAFWERLMQASNVEVSETRHDDGND